MFENEGAVDRCADMAFQRRIGIGLLECVEFPVLDVSKSRRKTLANQGEDRKNMIARAAGIGKMLLDFQNRVVIKQAVEDIDGLAFSRADWQYAKISVLVREMAVEFRTRFTAIVQIDVATLGGPITGTEELPIG